MSKHRIDSADTVEPAVHFLMRLASDGWAVESMNHSIEYVRLDKKGQRIPVEATVTVKLRPSR